MITRGDEMNKALSRGSRSNGADNTGALLRRNEDTSLLQEDAVPSNGLRTEAFPEKMRELRAAQAAYCVEEMLRGWILAQAKQFESYPAIAIFTSSDSGFALASYTGGNVTTSEGMETLGTEFEANAIKAITQDPELSLSAKNAGESSQKVFQSIELFLKWAGLDSSGSVGGPVLVRTGKIETNETINIVILPQDSAFSPASLEALEEISSFYSRKLGQVISSHHREELSYQEQKESIEQNDPATAENKEVVTPKIRRKRAPRMEALDLGEKLILTTSEAGILLGVSRSTVAKRFDRGEITGFRVPGSRMRRIPRAEFDKYFAKITGDGQASNAPR